MLFSRKAVLLGCLVASFALPAIAEAAPKRPSRKAASPPAVEEQSSEEVVTEDIDATEEETAPEDEASADIAFDLPSTDEPTSRVRKTWLSIGIAGDFAWVSGKNVCMLESQRDNGYSCFRTASSGKLEQYYGEPVVDEGNAISGGFRLRTGRVLVGIDHAIADNLSVGARAGFAFGGGPQGENDARGFLPLHLEARLAYWFGDEPFAKRGFRPYVFAAGGLAQVDARTRVTVVESTRPSYQPDNPAEQILVVWKKMGQGFAGLGGGVVYNLTESSGIVAEVKAMMMFPSSGMVLEPTVGYTFGF